MSADQITPRPETISFDWAEKENESGTSFNSTFSLGLRGDNMAAVFGTFCQLLDSYNFNPYWSFQKASSLCQCPLKMDNHEAHALFNTVTT